MDDLNSTLGAILGDPAKMEQLRQVAESLGINTGGNAPPPSQGPAQNPVQNQNPMPNPGQNGGGFDPSGFASILQGLQGAMGGGNMNQGAAAQSQPAANANPGGPGILGGLGNLAKIGEIMNQFNQSDKNVELLRSLKPHFSPERAGRIDDAVRIMQLLKAWPALRDSGLLGSLGNLFGGGGR